MTRSAGRPRTSPELHVLRGTPNRHAPSPKGERPKTTPRAPASLSVAGRDAWRIYWRYGRAWLAETDAPMVERLCLLVDDAAQLRATIEAEGFTAPNTRTRRSHVHAGYNSLLGIYSRIESLEAAAGMTPADRQRLRVEREEADDPVAQWMARP